MLNNITPFTFSTQSSQSQPSTPFVHRRRKSFSRASIRIARSIQRQLEHQQPVVNQLDGLNLPYADDSNAVTPCSEDIGIIGNHQSKFSFLAAKRASVMRGSDSRRESNASNASSKYPPPHSPADKLSRLLEQFDRNKGHHHLQPELEKNYDDVSVREHFRANVRCAMETDTVQLAYNEL